MGKSKKSLKADPISVQVVNKSGIQYIPRQRIISVLEQVFFHENIESIRAGVIVINDKEIRQMNKKYLNHDYPTDVLAFSTNEDPLEVEIYISVEFAINYSEEHNTIWRDEVVLYAIHGALHVIGYKDETEEEKQKMRYLEEKYLKLK